GNGAGTSWQITDIYGLQGLTTTLDANAVLANDIDASGTSGWNGGLGFEPIGTIGNPFSGSLNGQGNVIQGLTIVRPLQLAVGLFGSIDNDGVITGVGLSGGSVTGEDMVGALAGSSRGTISESYSALSVTGNSSIGGLVGSLAGVGAISQSYATGPVQGEAAVGGLVGFNSGSVSESYASGVIQLQPIVGGLV